MIEIPPFFIVGAPRSGTTMLRDIFKQIEDIYSPEETHFFRWATPFKGNEYNSIYENNKVLEKHREIDGITEEEFKEIYESSNTRREVNDKYCQKITELKGKKFWFEKTPQNVYGLPLLVDQYPEAIIIHIVRHPYDVVKSLNIGKVLKVDGIAGAANYWNESVSIVNVIKPFLGNRLIEIRYEDLTTSPQSVIEHLFSKLNLDSSQLNLKHIKYKTSDYSDFFSEKDLSAINAICSNYMKQYAYECQ